MASFKKIIFGLGAKVILGAVLIAAGVAVAQTTPAPPSKNPKIITPNISEFKDVRAPGSVREARACSEDIKRLCAAHTETRRNVRACLANKSSEVSLSCKAYMARTDNQNGN